MKYSGLGSPSAPCASGAGCCGPAASLPRRDFLRITGVASLAMLAIPGTAMAGPFTREDFERMVPADKKLSPEWAKSLFARGTPEVLRGPNLKFVGMPIGGIGAGQMYLSGDGRLWHWDIFNQPAKTSYSSHYRTPLTPTSTVGQSFALRIGNTLHALSSEGFADVSFRGGYPIATVTYADPAIPVDVKLEAFSPFIPLNADDSSLPATVLQYTVRNHSAAPVEATLVGELENAVCWHSRWRDGVLRNEVLRGAGVTLLSCSAESSPAKNPETRPDLAFESWRQSTYAGWTLEGNTFGAGPLPLSTGPEKTRQVAGNLGRQSAANTLASAATKLTSAEFTVTRNFITCQVAGGKARSRSNFGVTLRVGTWAAQTLAGRGNGELVSVSFDVRAQAGKKARLEIVDDGVRDSGGIAVGEIMFTDQLPGAMTAANDHGTMALALMGAPADEASSAPSATFPTQLSGSLSRKLVLPPGMAAEVTFVVAWHFPNLALEGPLHKAGRYYATKFPSAAAVAQHIATHFERLAGETKRWRDTWYDSTLPYWLLDRAMLNTSTLATSTCFRFADGRFYGWEGVACCNGTCTHVYHYAHAAGRLFPELERDTRERVDFGLALRPDGAMNFRGELNDVPAIDGQAGTILRALREHQTSADKAFLRRNWPGIIRATQWLIAQDGNRDGLLEGAQHNTLDSDWYGKVAWLSGLYLSALGAAAQMADEMADAAFAAQCRKIAARGRETLVAELFNGEYFFSTRDPKHPNSINSGAGCEIDQVFGQSWAFQVGLPRVLPQKETLAALQALWRYNFTPDVGPFREVNKLGRWFAQPGEAGLLMCTFPRPGWSFEDAKGENPPRPDFASYFNECMNGFEYQVAGHMIWEGMVLEGLTIMRSVHDRYHASKRNPWNEIECGDHYARSMASYGAYVAACGFEYHGPGEHLGFAPRLTPEKFQGAFTAAEGWGTFAQQRAGDGLDAHISVRWGALRLRTLALESATGTRAHVQHGGRTISSTFRRDGNRVVLTLDESTPITAGEPLEISIT